MFKKISPHLLTWLVCVRIVSTKPDELAKQKTERTMGNIKQIKLDGITYKVRYAYKRDDGTVWLVLNVDGGFYGEFGDEVPASVLI
jgi:hypothetical protein